jgi:hypothetical protein
MKRMVVGSVVLVLAIFSPSLFAQERDHGEVGVFVDYFRLNQANNANFEGIGGRVGFNVAPMVQVEGQITYDFEQSFNVSSTSGTTTATISRSSLTLLHGLIGPKITGGTEHARIFGTVQGGFVRFGVSNGSVVSGFTSSISSFGDTNTRGALYPGAGAELYVGPVGLRLDVGDFIYWNHGARHNLSVKFGPQIKF